MEIDLKDVGLGKTQYRITKLLDGLTDEQRAEVFYFYCQFCGTKQYRDPKQRNGCCCMRDD